MRRNLFTRLLGMVLLPLLWSCGGEALSGGGTNSSDTTQACTDPFNTTCCPEGTRKCTGDPDGQQTCTCEGLWDCSKNPNKCSRSMPTPTGGSNWQCTWTTTLYTCTEKGSQNTPPGGSGWTCSYNKTAGTWTCTSSFPPNPTNTPGGGSSWTCSVDTEFVKINCDKNIPTTSDGGVGTKLDGKTGTTPDLPAIKPGQECVPGQKRWCDGILECGFGQQTCAANGFWGTCLELADGRRPNTACACYYVYFNEKCCEHAGCVIGTNETGQICPTSAGTLCSYCNPKAPECGAGLMCHLTYDYQTYCTQACSTSVKCPTGYNCVGGRCEPAKGVCY